MNINWRNIRPLNGNQDKGFEELCAQLADAEKPPGAHFERKGTPDAGVECYAVLSDGSEWAWQAKYFDTLGDSQWSQLDKSVKTAIEKHPRLVRYFVCTPLDRPDTRSDGKKSAKDKWDEHVNKWTKLAADRGMTVEFVYWGSHELLQRLVRPEHVGRVRFWFDIRGFDAAWFKARLDEALSTAGPRYTPEIHVDLPIALEFEAFGRTARFFECEKARARAIRQELRSLEYFSKDAYDENIGAALATVSEKGQAVLTSISAIKNQPTGPLPFKAIVEQICASEKAIEELSRLLEEREREFEAKAEPRDEKMPSYQRNPFRDLRFRLFRMLSDLREARESLDHADCIANSPLMILRGAAGIGKTHLLCDVARQRIAAGRPTVLLMGQRFVSNDAPWSQALQQIDLAHISAEEFVGALEAAAQATNSRALLMVDALNEGTGRIIWPSHLAAFLAQVERSPWIGVVLAVRSSYEEIVIPKNVRERAVKVSHEGFNEHEYDATKTFFIHYGLELPSTPLLAPEFRNPLFLKTLCLGLNAKGEHRLPRGFQGITAIFDLYLSAINERLARILDFDRRTPLVRQALEALAEALLDSGKSWLSLDKVKEIADSFLPGRGYERSLYRGLVTEGVLVEEASLRQETPEEVVFVAYERFADHLAAKTLLDRHLDVSDPAAAFTKEGPLTFICDEKKYVSPGLLEALCIQLPERIGQELPSIAPNCMRRWDLGDAFRQSLIWRSYMAFSDKTREVLNKLCRNEYDLRNTLDVLLTVATLPGHPLNAWFLNRHLRKDTMPARDAWWSVYLHHAWGTHSAVDRLVDWTSSLRPGTPIEEETVELCAITLSWMLTTSNRFLRDRATKALVSLLTGRLDATVRLVERFADVDDPYVTERVYAVAYGVAMRCHNPVAIGALAQVVYDRVFATGSPPPHILLRDYARGVVERALYLGSKIAIIPEHIRPPYKSTWPRIPSEEEVKPLMPDWSRGSHDSGDLEWARNRIDSSVMNDDFAHYVIGTNWSSTSTSWLSLTIVEPPWKSPPGPEEQVQTLVAQFSTNERKAWEKFETTVKAYDGARISLFAAQPSALEREETSESHDFVASEFFVQMDENLDSTELAELEETMGKALTALEDVLTEEHTQRLREILAAKETYHETRQPPRFDLRQIQRYILWRVFDLGWTTERFGHFDRFSIGYHGREASKAERIGKKYQWIAYHEIMAFVSDHYQFREEFREKEGDQAYEGPWQEHLRDIDPSCTIRSLHGGTSWDGHVPAWWGQAIYDAWGDPNNPRGWVLKRDDLPKVEDLLIVTSPTDGSRWLNGQGYFNWKQDRPADLEVTEVEHRELWYIFTGYLVRADDAQRFLKWAEGVDFWGRWMPEAPEVYRMFLGEHVWAPAARYFQRAYYGNDSWTQPGHECPVKIRPIAFQYLSEAGGFDCSVDESFSLRLPIGDLVTGLGIRWSGLGADFVDPEGRIVTQDPAVHANGPTALLLREDVLRDFLARQNLTICWAVLGEKRVLSPGFGTAPHYPALRMSGAYILSEGHAIGFLRHMVDNRT